MKKYLKKTAIISVTFTFILAAIVISLNVLVSSHAIFRLENKSFIFGHSMPECAFNDSLIPNFQNVSESGESYFYTYIKCKKILEDNPQLKNIFIQFGLNNISKKMDTWTWGDKTMSHRYPRFSPFMTAAEHKLLFFNNPSGYINSLPIFIKYQVPRLIRSDFNYSDILGGHVSIVPKDEISIDSNLLDAEAPKENGISLNNILMLQKIIQLCKNNNKNIYLIRSPILHKDDHSESEILFEKIRTSKFSEIEFLDFSAFPLDESDFKDASHLNKLGADKFSIWFNEHIKSIIK